MAISACMLLAASAHAAANVFVKWPLGLPTDWCTEGVTGAVRKATTRLVNSLSHPVEIAQLSRDEARSNALAIEALVITINSALKALGLDDPQGASFYTVSTVDDVLRFAREAGRILRLGSSNGVSNMEHLAAMLCAVTDIELENSKSGDQSPLACFAEDIAVTLATCSTRFRANWPETGDCEATGSDSLPNSDTSSSSSAAVSGWKTRQGFFEDLYLFPVDTQCQPPLSVLQYPALLQATPKGVLDLPSGPEPEGSDIFASLRSFINRSTQNVFGFQDPSPKGDGYEPAGELAFKFNEINLITPIALVPKVILDEVPEDIRRKEALTYLTFWRAINIFYRSMYDACFQKGAIPRHPKSSPNTPKDTRARGTQIGGYATPGPTQRPRGGKKNKDPPVDVPGEAELPAGIVYIPGWRVINSIAVSQVGGQNFTTPVSKPLVHLLMPELDADPTLVSQCHVIVLFRGSLTDYEWITDFQFATMPSLDPDLLLQHGTALMSGAVLPPLQEMLAEALHDCTCVNSRITFTGHSLGASLSLSLSRLLRTIYNRHGCSALIEAVNFSAPRVTQAVSGKNQPEDLNEDEFLSGEARARRPDPRNSQTTITVRVTEDQNQNQNQNQNRNRNEERDDDKWRYNERLGNSVGGGRGEGAPPTKNRKGSNPAAPPTPATHVVERWLMDRNDVLYSLPCYHGLYHGKFEGNSREGWARCPRGHSVIPGRGEADHFDSPRGRIIIDYTKPQATLWKPLVPQSINYGVKGGIAGRQLLSVDALVKMAALPEAIHELPTSKDIIDSHLGAFSCILGKAACGPAFRWRCIPT